MSIKWTSITKPVAVPLLAGALCVAILAYHGFKNETASPGVDEPEIGAATASDWTGLPNIKNARFESTAVQYKDDLYVFNGFGPGIKIEPTVEKFDAQQLTWSVISNTSVSKGNAVTHNGFVLDGNEVWIIGGRLGNNPGPVTSKVWKFNLDLLVWSAGPELPVPGAAGGAALVDDRIHWFGGVDTQAKCDVDNHYVYDLNNPSAGWSDISGLAPMPVPRNHFATVVLNGLIYAIGGQFTHDGCGSGTPDTKLSHVFDPKTNTWDQIANLPDVQSHTEPSTFVYNGAIYVVGGATRGTKVYRYDPTKDEWDTVAVLPKALLAPAARVVGKDLIVSSGGAPSTVPSFATYKTDMTPLLLPGADDNENTNNNESDATDTDDNDSVPPIDDSSDSTPEDSNNNNNSGSEPTDLSDARESEELPDNTEENSSTASGNTAEDEDPNTAPRNTQNNSDSSNSVENNDAANSDQSASNRNCDYSSADVNGGWGWDPVSETTCPPLTPDDIQTGQPQSPSDTESVTTDDQPQGSEQTPAKVTQQTLTSGGGTTDLWLVLLLWTLSVTQLLPQLRCRRYIANTINIPEVKNNT